MLWAGGGRAFNVTTPFVDNEHVRSDCLPDDAYVVALFDYDGKEYCTWFNTHPSVVSLSDTECRRIKRVSPISSGNVCLHCVKE